MADSNRKSWYVCDGEVVPCTLVYTFIDPIKGPMANLQCDDSGCAINAFAANVFDARWKADAAAKEWRETLSVERK